MRPDHPDQLHLVVDQNVPRSRKASTEDIVAAYRETGSVWKAGKQLGMGGQSVHERLVAVGYPMRGRQWTEEEVGELRSLVAYDVPLNEIARRLGRPYAGVALKASRLEIRSARGKREQKPPRGAGYDKESIRRHLLALERYAGTVTQYARANGLEVESLVRAIERWWPERWQEYVRAHAELPQKTCEYCERIFYPNSGKQRFCTRQCQAQAKTDREYFGGNRRATVGLAAGICQLCGGSPKKGLSSHHYLGKENDPESAYLVALCRGCHKLVGTLAARKFIDDTKAWEALIIFAWMRRHAAELPDLVGENDERALNVYVELDIEPSSDEAEIA